MLGRARKDCLDAVSRDWLIQGFLKKKMLGLYSRVPWFRVLLTVLKWLNNNLRPLLICAINIVILMNIKERDDILPDFSNGACS